MLDPQILNNNLEEFKENLQKREIEIDLDVLIELDDNLYITTGFIPPEG